MNITKNTLRTINIVNAYCFAHGHIFIDYYPAMTGLGSRSAKWVVIKGNEKTDLNAAWYDNGHKTFTVFRREEKAGQLTAAIKWATKKYGIKKWASTPVGSWMDDGFVTARMLEIKRMLTAAQESGK